MSYLLDQPPLLSSLLENFELVILPDDDPEIRLYNLQLLDTCGSDEKPIVFARIKSSKEAQPNPVCASLYVPLAT